MDRTPLISLAPLRYRNVHVEDGGPIARISVGTRSMPDGSEWFDAQATLRSELKPDGVWPRSVLYSSADGGGCAPLPLIAQYKAISEAIERWAAGTVAADAEAAARCGFSIEPSTTGFAAFPGLFQRSARAAAFHEACERWTLAAFWEGRIGIELLGRIGREKTVEVFRLASPFRGVEVILLHRRSDVTGRHAYGFAADRRRASALLRASVELVRNEEVLAEYDRRKDDRGERFSEQVSDSIWERRVLHFSTDHGYLRFCERLNRSIELRHFESRLMPLPRLLVDTRIPGPWEKYAWVWRCVFEPVSDREQSEFEVFVF